MKRHASAAALAVSALVAFPTLASSAPDPKEQVVGNGLLAATATANENRFHINAMDSAKHGAKGNIRFTEVQAGRENIIVGDVVCLTVEGNLATIIYRDAKQSPDRSTEGGRITVQDNGKSQQDPPDTLRNSRLTGAAVDQAVADGCPVPDPPVRPLAQGDIRVSDDA
jgi:hypothetical protein